MEGMNDIHLAQGGREAAVRPPVARRRMALSLHEQPIRSQAALAGALLLFFVITYFESMNLLGLKVATLWRLAIVVVAAIVIGVRPFAVTATTRALEPVFLAFVAFASAPLLSIVAGSSDVQVALEVFAQRVFPIVVVMMVMSASRYDLADLLVRSFPIYLCLVSVPLLLGLLPSPMPPPDAVSGYDVNAYPGAFQNIHSAALAHALAAICTFTLLTRASGAQAVALLHWTLGCLALTVITTARSGLLAAVIGMIVVAALTRRLKALLVLVGLATFLALLVVAARPQLLDVATNRLLGRNAYAVDYSADAMSSGRLTLQKAAVQAFAGEPPVKQLFGIGRTASKKAIERYTSFYLIAHNAFVDELIAYGVFGLCSLVAMLAAAALLAWRNARAGHPAGLALLLALMVFALLQGIDYSLQLSVTGLVLLLETHARMRAASAVPPSVAGAVGAGP